MIGLSRALDMILTGRSLSAEEAFEWGLTNKIVACGTGNQKIVSSNFHLVRMVLFVFF